MNITMDKELQFLNTFVKYFGFYGITDYKYNLDINSLTVSEQKTLFKKINISIKKIEQLYSLRDFNLGRYDNEVTTVSVAIAVLKKCLQKTGIPYETNRSKGKPVMRLKSFSKMLMVYIRQMNVNSRAEEVNTIDKTYTLEHCMPNSFSTTSEVWDFDNNTNINIAVPNTYLIGSKYDNILTHFNPKMRHIISTSEQNPDLSGTNCSLFYVELLRYISYKISQTSVTMDLEFTMLGCSLIKAFLLKVTNFKDTDNTQLYVNDKLFSTTLHKLDLGADMKFYYCLFTNNIDENTFSGQISYISNEDKKQLMNICSERNIKVVIHTNYLVQTLLQNELKVFNYSYGVCIPKYQYLYTKREAVITSTFIPDKSNSVVGEFPTIKPPTLFPDNFAFVKKETQTKALLESKDKNAGYLVHFKKGTAINLGDVVIPKKNEKVIVECSSGEYELSATRPLYHSLSPYTPFCAKEDIEMWCVFLPIIIRNKLQSSEQVSQKDSKGCFIVYNNGGAVIVK